MVSINEHGLVVGYGSNEDCNAPGMSGERVPHAFVWVNGTTTALPTLGGGNASSPGPAYALEDPSTGVMNDRGQIVGWSTTGQDDYCYSPVHAVLWTLKHG